MLTINSRTGALLARAPAGEYPDGLAFDSAQRRVFVSDESGGVETVLSTSGHRIATISFGRRRWKRAVRSGERYPERFVRTIRVECRDWLLILGRRHLHHTLRVFVELYNS